MPADSTAQPRGPRWATPLPEGADVDMSPCGCGAQWTDRASPFGAGPRQLSRLHEPGCEEVAHVA